MQAPAPAPAPASAKGAEAAFRVRVADQGGVELHTDPGQAAVPSDRQARQLVFDVQIDKDGPSPTVTDMALYRELSRIEHALIELYPPGQADAESRFRLFFVRLFYIAQLALEGDVKVEAGQVKSVGGRLSAEAAKAEIQAIADELIEDEAPRIKNRHLRELGRWTAIIGAPALAAYVLISLLAPVGKSANEFSQFMLKLHVDPGAAANFMLLWAGTMVGVCLSYAFRTTTVSLADLTRTDGDHLSPQLRLLITGTLAVILVLMAVLNLGDVTIGSMSISRAAELPMLAFVVGAILGIGEQKLSGTVATRAGELFGVGK
ncbi:MAG: hypothetical protein V4795_24020 [Pseudomonadota bacterium]